ncbi:PE family protein [Mycobacterium sp. 852002-50816_SCH5313054-b]|uniref:PE family protein n=1 Tax=Mycobacterium sp. 852002-50816_SCH5313054-b TaxID=1834092 RepID=UPI000ABF1D88|nr:PE family protein [Mycobacterium sp. 852002-50816_SCH5313054-b]
MAYVIASPEMVAAAATDVSAIGSTLGAAHTAAAASIAAVLPPAADEVSAAIAQVFSGAAQEFQGLLGKATAFGEHFAQQLTAGAGSYAAAEAVNAASVAFDPNSIIQGLIDAPASLLSAFNGLYNSTTGVLKFFLSFLELPVYIGYEALVLTYLTLAGLIALEQTLAKLLTGATIPIP